MGRTGCRGGEAAAAKPRQGNGAGEYVLQARGLVAAAARPVALAHLRVPQVPGGRSVRLWPRQRQAGEQARAAADGSRPTAFAPFGRLRLARPRLQPAAPPARSGAVIPAPPPVWTGNMARGCSRADSPAKRRAIGAPAGESGERFPSSGYGSEYFARCTATTRAGLLLAQAGTRLRGWPWPSRATARQKCSHCASATAHDGQITVLQAALPGDAEGGRGVG